MGSIDCTPLETTIGGDSETSWAAWVGFPGEDGASGWVPNGQTRRRACVESENYIVLCGSVDGPIEVLVLLPVPRGCCRRRTARDRVIA